MLGKIKLTREQTWNLALIIGKVLLKNGAETSRVEDTITRFCHENDCKDINVFVTPAVILLGDESTVNPAVVCRIRWRSTNLSNISLINDFTYNLKSWTMDYDETVIYLNSLLETPPSYSQAMTCLGSAVSSGCFAVLFGGDIYDFVAAFITGGLTMYFIKSLSGYRMSVFWENAVAGLSIGAIALICHAINSECTLEQVIVGALMPFLPGLAFTNGLRDYMAGDLISGNCRTSEALLFAISLAIGLAASLLAWHNWGWALWR
ncbi:MAG: threonine/serine exporter family protein [Phascolarctobacterium sp.]|nr:threonine/serine exporter family protein [Phascolarctobacterium sp.]